MTNIDGIDYKVTSKAEFEQIKKSIKTNQIKDSEKSLFIEELEKIKTEIGNEFVDLQDGSEEWRSYVNEAVLSCYEIVDKHISELKENKKGVLESIAEEQKTLLESTKVWSNYIDKNGNIY